MVEHALPPAQPKGLGQGGIYNPRGELPSPLPSLGGLDRGAYNSAYYADGPSGPPALHRAHIGYLLPPQRFALFVPTNLRGVRNKPAHPSSDTCMHMCALILLVNAD